MICFTKQEKVVVAFLAVALLTGAAVLSYRHVVRKDDGTIPIRSTNRAAGATAVRGVQVRVSGAVLHPGMYEAAPESAVFDVVDRAVPVIDADLTHVTDAAVVRDGMEIVVPRRAGENDRTQDARININTATAGELDALPGIGPHLAERIIANRRIAPFQEIDDLKNVSGIGEKKFAAIKDRVKTK